MFRFIKIVCVCAILPLLLLTAVNPVHGGAITSVAISGPGLGPGSASYTIDNNTIPAAPAVYYQVAFTSIAPIDFTITVDSPGLYYLSFATPPGSVLNSTGTTITGLAFSLVNGPSGTILNSGQFNTNYPLSQTSFPSSTSFRLDGPPNLASGAWTAIGAGYTVGGTGGPQTITVRLTPYTEAAVPEPTSLVSLGIGATLLGLGIRGSRREV